MSHMIQRPATTRGAECARFEQTSYGTLRLRAVEAGTSEARVRRYEEVDGQAVQKQ
jgi:hypothetical protein